MNAMNRITSNHIRPSKTPRLRRIQSAHSFSLPPGLLLFVLAVFKWQPLSQTKRRFGSSEEPWGAVCSSQPAGGAASPPQNTRIQPGFLLGRALLRHKAVPIFSVHIQAVVWSKAFIILSRDIVHYQQLIPQTRSPACLGFKS